MSEINVIYIKKNYMIYHSFDKLVKLAISVSELKVLGHMGRLLSIKDCLLSTANNLLITSYDLLVKIVDLKIPF